MKLLTITSNLRNTACWLAEGLPAESYLDTGNRAAFETGGRVARESQDA